MVKTMQIISTDLILLVGFLAMDHVLLARSLPLRHNQNRPLGPSDPTTLTRSTAHQHNQSRPLGPSNPATLARSLPLRHNQNRLEPSSAHEHKQNRALGPPYNVTTARSATTKELLLHQIEVTLSYISNKGLSESKAKHFDTANKICNPPPVIFKNRDLIKVEKALRSFKLTFEDLLMKVKGAECGQSEGMLEHVRDNTSKLVHLIEELVNKRARKYLKKPVNQMKRRKLVKLRRLCWPRLDATTPCSQQPVGVNIWIHTFVTYLTQLQKQLTRKRPKHHKNHVETLQHSRKTKGQANYAKNSFNDSGNKVKT